MAIPDPLHQPVNLMKKYVLLLLPFIVFSFPATAQIIIPESTLTARLGNTIESVSYDFALNSNFQTIINTAGENQSWDLTGFVVVDTFQFAQTYLPASSDIPGNELPEFANADFVIASEEELDDVTIMGYVHQTLENGELRSLGTTVVGGDVDMDGMDDVFHTFLDPAELLEVFPVAFGNMWSDSTSTTFSTAPGTVISTEEVASEVDGWGTLATDFGTFEVLRSTTTLLEYSFPGVPPTQTTFIEFITPEGNTFAISIDGSGDVFGAVLSLSEGEMVGTSNEDVNEVPAEFALSQNFPNPFNPQTRIVYSIPEAGNVTLTVYTVTGKEVVTLVNGTRAAGSYEVTLDASDLASGVYLYRLETARFSETRMMNLIK